MTKACFKNRFIAEHEFIRADKIHDIAAFNPCAWEAINWLKTRSTLRHRNARFPLELKLALGCLILHLFSCSAFAGTFTAFGPQSYVRNTGGPVTVSNTFSVLNPHTQYTLHIENSGISSAVISLNGVQVLGPSDFNGNSVTIDKSVNLQLNNQIDVQLRSKPGSSLTVSIIGIDNDPPVITASATPAADSFGWNNSNVLVTFTCSDKTSGVASCPAPVTVSTEGTNQIINGTATDRAGNSASASITINLDKTRPTIVASAVPPANSFGWNNAAVTVTFNCQDQPAMSGIATCTAPATLNAEAAGQIAAGSAVDKAGNISSTSVTINIDKTPPTVTATATPAANVAGWNNTNVSVAFTCADNLSGVSSCPSTTIVSTEGASQMISGTAFDKAGNSASTGVPVSLDKTPPSITSSLVPAANTFGWNNSSVTVNFTCSDTLSGVASCTPATTFTREGANQTASGNAADVAGNTSSTSASVNIDETPPTITASASPAPNANGWNNADVTVSFACADALSGVASCPAPQTVGVEGANQIISGTATDKAGNTAAASTTLKIDKTPPMITATASPLPNAAGWNNTNVIVIFNCSDALSGVDSCAAPVTVSTEGANQAISGTARDSADNTNSATPTLNIDKTPPALTITSPVNGAIVIVPTVTLEGLVTDALSGVAGVTCNSVPAQVSGSSLTCGVPLSAGANVISIVATDVAGNMTTVSRTVSFSATPTIAITSPTNLTVTNTTPVTVAGTVSDPNAVVNVNGIAGPLSSGSFSVPVPLKEGGNTITVVAQSGGGTPATATISISLDTTPPHVTIDSPPDGTVTTASTIAVSGLINDIVPGTVNSQQASVIVNGMAAQVLNRKYLLRAVPLSPGPNTITAVGTDIAGNTAQVSITVVQKAATQPTLSLVSGDSQTATIGTPLAAPLVVQLKDGAGNPVSSQPVVFKVTGSNGTLSGNAIAGDNGGPTLVVNSDSSGLAQVNWTLGMRAGAGNNTVRATATNFIGEADFSAISMPATPGLISLDSGNNQLGAVGQPLPMPFVVVVTDPGHNRLPNIPVTFTVKQGGGTFTGQGSQIPQPGQTTFDNIIVKTDSDGRAMAILTLGQQEGINNNLVEANFTGNQGFSAAFTASGRVAGDPAATSISGVVLDNTNIPIAGITMSVEGTALTTQSDLQGQFVLTGVPVGTVKLKADGSTAARPGTWPTLEYMLVTVSGQNNTLGMPVYLLPLDLPHGLQVDETHGGTLTLPDVPGFSLTVAPGSVTFPDGGKSGLVSVTLVHADKVPMTPNFGQQPRFIISIQPAGAHFNPPAPMTMPNVDGLSPGEVTEMYSFDHDLGSFVAIGTGTVSKDGSVLKSDPGVGIIKGGWHCGGNPNPGGSVATCGPCAFCNGINCVPNPTQGNSCLNPCIAGGNGICTGGQCIGLINLQPGTPCNGAGRCDGQGHCTLPNCSVTCNSGNPCITDLCFNNQCNPTPNPLCQQVCLGQATGSNCTVNGVSGTCQNGLCQLCGSIPAGTACVNGGQTPSACNSNGQCQGSGTQCPSGCANCINGQCPNACQNGLQITPPGGLNICSDGSLSVLTDCSQLTPISASPQSGSTYSWTISVTNNQPSLKVADLPNNTVLVGLSCSLTCSQATTTGDWQIQFGSSNLSCAGSEPSLSVLGGNAQVTANACSQSQSVSFNLQAQNPAKSDVQKLISDLGGDDYLKRIACLESNECGGQCQFMNGLPFITANTAVGIMQVTRKDHYNTIRCADLWDWKQNVQAGVLSYQDAVRLAQTDHIRQLKQLNDSRSLPCPSTFSIPPLSSTGNASNPDEAAASQLTRQAIGRYNGVIEYRWVVTNPVTCDGSWQDQHQIYVRGVLLQQPTCDPYNPNR